MKNNTKIPDNKLQQPQQPEPVNPTDTSLKDGKDAMKMERKLTPGNEAEKDNKAKNDAEQWRNEG